MLQRRRTSTKVHFNEKRIHQTMSNPKKMDEPIHCEEKLSMDKLQNKLEDCIQPLTCICGIWNIGFSNVDCHYSPSIMLLR